MNRITVSSLLEAVIITLSYWNLLEIIVSDFTGQEPWPAVEEFSIYSTTYGVWTNGGGEICGSLAKRLNDFIFFRSRICKPPAWNRSNGSKAKSMRIFELDQEISTSLLIDPQLIHPGERINH